MTKVKVTLSCEKILIDIAKKDKLNLSLLLENAIMLRLKLERVTYVKEVREYY